MSSIEKEDFKVDFGEPDFASSDDFEEDEEEEQHETDKPMEIWENKDFPNKPRTKPRGLNWVLQAYSNARKAVFKKKDVDEEAEPVCCDGISGIIGLLFLLIADVVYVGYCISCNQLATEDDIRLVWLSVIVWVVILIKLLRRLIRQGRQRGGCFSCFASLGDFLGDSWSGFKGTIKKAWNSMWNRIDSDPASQQRKKEIAFKAISIGLMSIFTILCLVFFVILKDVRNLVSLSGMLILLLIAVLISKHPGRINWQPVIGGFFIQLVFAVLTLQTQPGFVAFQFLGDRMAEFLENSFAGSEFLFGSFHSFAFDVLPVIIFFSSFISVLFHLGIINLLIDKPSYVVTALLKTTGPETLNAVANIFVSMTESPLITRPYMHMMTNSELMSIMVNGFASVAGSVLAAYISFGVPANHLLIACVMSAPAALAVSKIIYPETKKAPLAKIETTANIKSPYNNALEAAAIGAMEGAPIVAGIASNLIAFLSIYNFFNRTLTWLGYRACMVQNLTFELIFSYVLWPIAFTMGVPSEDCLKVAELIGVKSMLNEFVAFERLGILIKNGDLLHQREPGTPVTTLPDGNWQITLVNGTNIILEYGALYTRRAEVIATYALCGFANIGSIGIMLGSLVTMLPHRRHDLSTSVLTAMIGGTIACFITGCFAGLFFDGE